MQPFLSDPFLDRVRRAYALALDLGARTGGHTWKSIDARRADVHAALVKDGNAALREIFIDPTATDLYFGVDNLCRSHIGTLGGRSFLELALASPRATRGQYQALQLRNHLGSIGGTSAIEIGPGMGHCAFYAYRGGVEDYTTIDLPLGVVAQARFLAEALGPDKIWLDGERELVRGQIKLFSIARLPQRNFDAALNVDSMTEMSLTAALDYLAWINRHARLFISINHELNPFTVADIAKHSLTARCLERIPIPEQPGYFQETFLVAASPSVKRSLFWLKIKTLFWTIAVPIRWRIPFLRPKTVPGITLPSANPPVDPTLREC